MLNNQLNITLYTETDRFTPCIRYILEFFAKIHGHNLHVAGETVRAIWPDIRISYGIDLDASEHPTIYITRDSFFGKDFGTNPVPPFDILACIDAAQDGRFETIMERDANTARIRADIIASSFYFLSGYHDWTCKVRDTNGRVLAAHIDLPEFTWDRPVVNHLFIQLNKLILSLTDPESQSESNAPAFPSNQTVCLTHDVDLLRKYSMVKLPRQLYRAMKAGDVSPELTRARSVISGKQRDPFDSFEALYTVKERISAPSTFFFMGSDPSSRNGDYKVGHRDVRNHIIRAKTFGDEIALHGSWNSTNRAAVLKDEKETVQKAAATKVTGSRQHYLRFSTPATWKNLSEVGIRYDSTGGFPDRCGFKYGWSGCFHPFDFDTMAPLSILEIPLICMDVTLAVYEKIPAELTLERLTNLLDAATENVPGGAFVFLWHNTMGDKTAYPGYWDTFEYFFSIASGSARFITLNQLCDEFDGTPVE